MGFWIQSDEQFSYTLSFSPTSYICAKKTILFFSNCGLGIKRVDEIISMFSSSLTLKLLFYPHILIACVNSYYVLDKLLTTLSFYDLCDFSAPLRFMRVFSRLDLCYSFCFFHTEVRFCR